MRIYSRVMLLFGVLLWSWSAFASGRPNLVVIIVIDQMRSDHMTRYASLYEAGFKRMMNEGVAYTAADLNYAGTATGPGHATLGTGVYPWKSGIVANNYLDRSTGKKVYCVSDSTAAQVEGTGGSMSPRNLLVPAFGDWLKSASPSSKVISISYKDRAALLMGGKRPNAAFWFDRKAGRMTTSSYYMTMLPGWMKEFNGSGWIAKHLPAQWTKLLPETAYEQSGPDDMAGEPLWLGKRTFPHAIEQGKEVARLFSTPWGNDYLLDVAMSAIDREQLGTRGTTDVLWVSLSTTDDIGSEFGPNSHEMIDNLVRIDRALGAFLENLDARFKRGDVMVALSGDHGVMQTPEYLNQFEQIAARRIDNEAAIDRTTKFVDSTLRAEYGITERIIKSGRINEQALNGSNASMKTVEQQLREALLRVDGVADVVFRRELLDPATPDRPYLELFRHSCHPDRTPDFVIRDCEYCLTGEDTTGSSHGAPYLYDRLVPLLFWGTDKAPRRVDRIVHTVDLTATIARVLEIPMPQNLDGVPLEEVIQ